MRSRTLPLVLAAVIIIFLGVSIYYLKDQNLGEPTPVASPSVAPSLNPESSPLPGASSAPATDASPRTTNMTPDLTTDQAGLSKATAVLSTDHGQIKFKFYPKDAPKTVERMIQLINQGFYNGIVFHRVVPGFVVQAGDPTGTGAGGSGQKLEAEFNERHHLEGTLAMARTQDPNSADSQFYICLAPQPRLDRMYTVFGQVIEGMDAVRKLKMGDKINSIMIE